MHLVSSKENIENKKLISIKYSSLFLPIKCHVLELSSACSCGWAERETRLVIEPNVEHVWLSYPQHYAHLYDWNTILGFILYFCILKKKKLIWMIKNLIKRWLTIDVVLLVLCIFLYCWIMTNKSRNHMTKSQAIIYKNYAKLLLILHKLINTIVYVGLFIFYNNCVYGS